MTHNARHVTHNARHVTRNMRHTFGNPLIDQNTCKKCKVLYGRYGQNSMQLQNTNNGILYITLGSKLLNSQKTEVCGSNPLVFTNGSSY